MKKATLDAVIVIPARQGSKRFPGKPLAPISGRPLLERTWRIAKAVPGVRDVVIATDDAGLAAKAKAFGATAVMTPPECRNGTERAFAALKALKDKPELVVNLQADAVLTPPWVIEPVVRALAAEPGLDVATPAVRLSWAQYEDFVKSKAGGKVSGTSVVSDLEGRALYFSKAVLPFLREKPEEPLVWRHIGLYAYRRRALEAYASWPPSPLELAEGLEQLRFLEHGTRIRVVPVDYRGRRHWSVDNPEDVGIVEKIIAEEGELV